MLYTQQKLENSTCDTIKKDEEDGRFFVTIHFILRSFERHFYVERDFL